MSALVLGELRSEGALLAAARALKARGFASLELHSPFPLEDTDDVLGPERSWLPALTLVCGLGGATLAYLIQWYTDAVDWPLVVGGRPIHAAPAFVPIVFETGVLCAAAAAFFGALRGSKLPHLTHPVFESDAFRSATQDGFWVSIAVADDAEANRAVNELGQLGAAQVQRVEAP